MEFVVIRARTGGKCGWWPLPRLAGVRRRPAPESFRANHSEVPAIIDGISLTEWPVIGDGSCGGPLGGSTGFEPPEFLEPPVQSRGQPGLPDGAGFLGEVGDIVVAL